MRSSVRGRVGEQADDLQLLDDRAGPTVRDDQRHRTLVLGTDVNEVNVQSVHLGDELRQGVETLLALRPVVLRPPVARELLDRRERHALRIVRNRLPLGPPRRGYSPAQVGEFRLGKGPLKGMHGVLTGARLPRCVVVSGDRAHSRVLLCAGEGKGVRAAWARRLARGSLRRCRTPVGGTSPAGWTAFLSLTTKQPVRSAGGGASRWSLRE